VKNAYLRAIGDSHLFGGQPKGLPAEGYDCSPGVYPNGVRSRRTLFSRNWLPANMKDAGKVSTGGPAIHAWPGSRGGGRGYEAGAAVASV